jgi:hypothetical protein
MALIQREIDIWQTIRMINLYRCIRYPNSTLVTFQCPTEDVANLNPILPFPIYKSNLARSRQYESGYYVRLNEPQREQYEYKALAYLSQHFCPPSVELLIFSGDRPLSRDWSPDRWLRFLTKTLRKYFENNGYFVLQRGLGHEIYRISPCKKITPELEAHAGITYRIQLTQEFVPQIQVDVVHRFHHQGQSVSPKTLQARFGNQPDVLAACKNFTTRSTDYIFEFAKRFIKRISEINELRNLLTFIPEPINAKLLGLETYFWEHDAPIQIEAANRNQVPFALHISQYNLGLYKPLYAPTIIIVLHPDSIINKWCLFSNWAGINELIQQTGLQDLINRTVYAMLGETIDVPLVLKDYQISDSAASLVGYCQEILERFKNFKPLFVIIAPPETSQNVNNPELKAANSFTFELDKSLRKLPGAYTVTVGCDNLVSDYERQYSIENALLKAFMVLGATPWRILNIAHTNDEVIDEICFIGVDVNIHKPVPVVGGVVLDAYGVLRGYHLVRLENPNGDDIDADSFSYLINKLLQHYQFVTGIQPRHLIIHRDGIVGDEAAILVNNAAKLGIRYDLIEIRKSGAPRLKQIGNFTGTPSKDIAIGSEESSTAYMVNTLAFYERLSSGEFVFPAPESITIHRVAGSTPVKILAAQVYALSRAYYGSYRRPQQLPATIAYSDALVNHASLKPNQSNSGRAIDSSSRPYWL